jgi:hypothetical protein
VARLPFDVESLATAGGVYDQVERAKRKLAEKIQDTTYRDSAEGLAHYIVETWQDRLLELLHSEIPEWRCLAAFRSIIDFNINPSTVPFLKDAPIGPVTDDPIPDTIETQEELLRAYREYFGGRDLHAGKFHLRGQIEKDLFQFLGGFEPKLGGQAGNILWLLQFINGRACGYVPYLAEQLKGVPEIRDVPFLEIDSKAATWKRLDATTSGVASDTPPGREPAPYGASLVIAQLRRRMILQLKGFRVFGEAGDQLPFRAVEYQLDGKALAPPIPVLEGGNAWPQVPFFAAVFLQANTLVIDILGPERLRRALQDENGSTKPQMAVMGGLNAVFYDEWAKRNPALQARLAQIVELQMHVMRDLGIRIGAELSGRPDRDFFEMLKRLCRDGTIVALGINGEDELTEITSFGKAPPVSYDLHLDPTEIQIEIRAGAHQKTHCAFPFITYLRACRLAGVLGVRTLYVHTTSIDILVRRDADPGSLATAQHAAFLGKGLVLAALMKKSYGDDWMDHMPSIPLAVNPESMQQLWCFAQLFDKHVAAGSDDSLLTTGLWYNPEPGGYSVAVLPVIWPSVDDQDRMPPEFNATGAGDMTLGTVFYLGGL